jgi:hypothetical protein
LPKCMYCGGWGVGLVSESTGMCAHCTRLRDAKKEAAPAKKEAAPATTTASPATTSASPAPSPKEEVASAPAKVSISDQSSAKRKTLSSLLSEID